MRRIFDSLDLVNVIAWNGYSDDPDIKNDFDTNFDFFNPVGEAYTQFARKIINIAVKNDVRIRVGMNGDGTCTAYIGDDSIIDFAFIDESISREDANNYLKEVAAEINRNI